MGSPLLPKGLRAGQRPLSVLLKNKTADKSSDRRAYQERIRRLRFSFFVDDFDLRSRAIRPCGRRSARARHEPRRPSDLGKGAGLARLCLGGAKQVAEKCVTVFRQKPATKQEPKQAKRGRSQASLLSPWLVSVCTGL